MRFIKNMIVKIVPNKIKVFLGQKEVAHYKKSMEYATISYSQEGEDLIINRFLERKENGFYIDVGAHHPRRFSNTYNFYLRGWTGINIDAMPGSMDAFKLDRPKDINLEMGVSKIAGELVFHMFNEPALNTFSESEANRKDGLRKYKIIDKRKVNTHPLNEILREHLREDEKIDFMSIDVEGLDLEVVESNDWEKYRPSLVLVEDLEKYALTELPLKSNLYKMLVSNEYELVAKTFNTLFFKDIRT
jgi:FkbM family methyltransferase